MVLGNFLRQATFSCEFVACLVFWGGDGHVWVGYRGLPYIPIKIFPRRGDPDVIRMMKKTILYWCLLAVLLALSCEKNPSGGGGKQAAWPLDGNFTTLGAVDTVDFTYALLDGKPLDRSVSLLKNRPVLVLYYIPRGFDIKKMPVLFAMSGAERVGTTQTGAWKPFADKYGFILVAPQFLRESDLSAVDPSRKAIYKTGTYWQENDYQFGHVATEVNSSNLYPRGQWTYNIIELLFDYLCHETGNTSDGYYIFGHSAGAQFVNRMVMAFPEARIKKAVAANPSTWAWPALDDGVQKMDDGGNYLYNEGGTAQRQLCGWPYNLHGIYGTSAELKAPFGKKLYIQIGSKDVETSSLDMSVYANATGSRRLYRARNFYKVCKDVAAASGLTCSFVYAEVDGADHSTYRMVYGLPSGQYSSKKIRYEDLGPNAAFTLLFKGVLEYPSGEDEEEGEG